MIRDNAIEQAVEAERHRCLKCVEAHYEFAKSMPGGEDQFGPHSMLWRIANMIRSGNDDPLPPGPDQMFS